MGGGRLGRRGATGDLWLAVEQAEPDGRHACDGHQVTECVAQMRCDG